jgi:hypothetical protein
MEKPRSPPGLVLITAVIVGGLGRPDLQVRSKPLERAISCRQDQK